MKVTIDGREHDFDPNFYASNKQWQTQAPGAHFIYPVPLGDKLFFVKRFQSLPSGWDILKSLKDRIFENMPRIYSLVEAVENDNKVYYAFYEYLEGATLKDLLNQNDLRYNSKSIFLDLAKALNNLFRNRAWFSDFCEKNFYYAKQTDHVYLIDLDSVWDLNIKPNNDRVELGGIISHDYMSPIIEYFKAYLGNTSFNINQLRGDQVNWLQLIFFSLKLKYYTTQKKLDPKYTYTRPIKLQEITDNLALLLHRFSHDYGLVENCQMLFTKAKNSQLSYQDVVEFGSKIFDLQPQILRLEPAKARIRVGETTSFKFLTQGQSQVEITPNTQNLQFESFDVMPEETTAYTLSIKDVFGQEASAVKQIQVRPKSALVPMLSSIRSGALAALIVISGGGVYWWYNSAVGSVDLEPRIIVTPQAEPKPTEPSSELESEEESSPPPTPEPVVPALSPEEAFDTYYAQAVDNYRANKIPEAIALLEKALKEKKDHRAENLLRELKSYGNE